MAEQGPDAQDIVHQVEQQQGRQKQADRSAAMKQRLMEAVLDCLAERGYGKTSTTEIARRADVTRGAQVHHFQTKHQMMAATVDYIFTQIGEKSRESLPKKLDPVLRRDRLFILLESEIFHGRLFVASLELMAAARTDPSLADILRPQVDRWMTVYAGAVRRYLGLPRHKNKDVEALLRMTAALMRGFAVESPLQTRKGQSHDLFTEWARLARPLIMVSS